MTLNTRIVVHRPIAVYPLFQFCRDLLDTPPGTPVVTDVPWRPRCGRLGNPGGIGLPAWLDVFYGADGPIIEPPGEGEDEDDIAYREASPAMNGWAAIQISFDTGYAYIGSTGGAASDLHAWLIEQVGAYLDRLNTEWKWQNEFTGEWYDKYEGLDDFGDAEFGALTPVNR